VRFRNSTFGAEYKCTDLERYGVKMDGIVGHVTACLRPVIYTPFERGGVNLTMAFAMLRNLGESKFNTLQNELARGKAPLALARTIRSQWGEFKDSSDTLLAMQLTRLRKHMALGKMGKQMPVTIEANRRPDVRALKSPNLDVFQELVALATMQRIRVQALWEKEITSNKPCPLLNAAVMILRDMLLSVRKMKVELGIEEELAGLSMPNRTDGNKQSDLEKEQQMHKAMAAVQEIFRKRDIVVPTYHPPIPVESENRFNRPSDDRDVLRTVRT
jgi:hypothetical protein